MRQSVEVQQEPLRQAPSQHTEPAPQSPFDWHPSQRPARQACPCGQSAAEQQAPCRQSPEQHTDPAPHCAEVVQPRHSLPTQTRPAHEVLSQQLPRLHEPAQQTEPAAH